MAGITDIRPEMTPGDLTAVGLHVINIISDRTLKGQGIDGPFPAYSTRPFAMPAGGITESARSALADSLHYFTTQRGTLWAIVEGGYAAFKAAAYPQDGGTPNLHATGRMMAGLTIVSVNTSTNTVVIGFTTPEEAEKAWYHNVSGAGKRRVLRRFMGLTEQEQQQVATFAAARIIVKV